jgi:hypothetical protein
MKNSKGLFIQREYKRVPRKLKKKIPKGTHYCYTPLEFPNEQNNWVYKIKPCPFYTWIKFKDMNPIPYYYDENDLKEFAEENISWCKLVKLEVQDQCKSCSYNYPKI